MTDDTISVQESVQAKGGLCNTLCITSGVQKIIDPTINEGSRKEKKASCFHVIYQTYLEK